MKVTLHLAPYDGGPFNCLPARTVELDTDHVICNDVVLPDEFNPHGVRLWVIGNEFGAIGAVWANCLQDALDELVDSGLGGGLLCDEPTSPEEEEDITRLGNFGEPADLTYVWAQEVQFDPARDWKLLCSFAEARGEGADNLDR